MLAFNLILCYFALGDKERMKKGFQKLVSLKIVAVEQNEDSVFRSSPSGQRGVSPTDDQIDDHEIFNEDALRFISRERYLNRILVKPLFFTIDAENLKGLFYLEQNSLLQTSKELRTHQLFLRVAAGTTGL